MNPQFIEIRLEHTFLQDIHTPTRQVRIYWRMVNEEEDREVYIFSGEPGTMREFSLTVTETQWFEFIDKLHTPVKEQHD